MAGTEERARLLPILSAELQAGGVRSPPISKLLSMTTAWGKVLPDDSRRGERDIGFYVFAVAAGGLAGWVDIKVGDLLLTALLVLGPCMILGAMRPAKPWRWVLIVGAFVPVVELAGYVLLTAKPYRAQVYESFLAFLPGIAGAYGGALMRRAIQNIFSGA